MFMVMVVKAMVMMIVVVDGGDGYGGCDVEMVMVIGKNHCGLCSVGQVFHKGRECGGSVV